jgi:demethylmenaquinone methyltransferase / 2-methoxy-6-polyprenyl-1,4-benzoquinol methylase
VSVTLDTPTPGAPERDSVRAMFDRIARRYDFLNHFLSAGVDRRWRRAGIDALSLASGSRLLDLCSGTADVLVEWLRRDPRNRGVGVDFSSQMLRIGWEKLRQGGHAGRGALAITDAACLPFEEERFDGAIVAFGLRNITARVTVLREVARVLRPGAPFVAVELGWPRGWLASLYGFYSAHVLPRVGGRLSGEAAAYAYLPESARLFPAPDAFDAELRAAGLRETSARSLTGGIAWLYRAVKAA